MIIKNYNKMAQVLLEYEVLKYLNELYLNKWFELVFFLLKY
jgi:hypothetical protein